MNTFFKKFYLKLKESFQTAIVASFIVLLIILILYIPFKIIPKIVTNGTSFIATTISSLFIPNEDQTEKDTITTKKEKMKENITETKSPIYFGKADLSINLIGIGIIDKNTGQFYQTDNIGSNNIVGIKFEIRNIGTNISGVWRLRLAMPSKTTPDYNSDYQISLRPGDRIEYTASFEKPIKIGINTGYITADYFNSIDEITKSNNYLTVPIRITSKNNNYSDELKLSCGANTTRTSTGNIVTWSATVTGGIGQPLYSWYGSDGLLSIQSPQNGVKKTYYNTGNKTARVSVSVGNQIISGDCGSVTIR